MSHYYQISVLRSILLNIISNTYKELNIDERQCVAISAAPKLIEISKGEYRDIIFPYILFYTNNLSIIKVKNLKVKEEFIALFIKVYNYHFREV